MSLVQEGAVGRRQSRTASISSTASTEEILCNFVSRQECQHIEAKKLNIENRVIDLKLSQP